MMHFEGDQDFEREPAFLWAKLRDATFLVNCIPHASIERTSDKDRARCTVRPAISFVRGSLDLSLSITEAVEPTSVKVFAVSKGIGSGSDIEGVMTFIPEGSGVRVRWSAEVKNMTGLFKMAPPSLIRTAAQKIIQDLWNNIRRSISQLEE